MNFFSIERAECQIMQNSNILYIGDEIGAAALFCMFGAELTCKFRLMCVHVGSVLAQNSTTALSL